MTLVERGYGTWDQIEAWTPMKRRIALYASHIQHGMVINWETGDVRPPPTVITE